MFRMKTQIQMKSKSALEQRTVSWAALTRPFVPLHEGRTSADTFTHSGWIRLSLEERSDVQQGGEMFSWGASRDGAAPPDVIIHHEPAASGIGGQQWECWEASDGKMLPHEFPDQVIVPGGFGKNHRRSRGSLVTGLRCKYNIVMWFMCRKGFIYVVNHLWIFLCVCIVWSVIISYLTLCGTVWYVPASLAFGSHQSGRPSVMEAFHLSWTGLDCEGWMFIYFLIFLWKIETSFSPVKCLDLPFFLFFCTQNTAWPLGPSHISFSQPAGNIYLNFTLC